MPAERTPMRQVREVLRLKFVGGVPIREIARRIGVPASTVRMTINHFQAAAVAFLNESDAIFTILPPPFTISRATACATMKAPAHARAHGGREGASSTVFSATRCCVNSDPAKVLRFAAPHPVRRSRRFFFILLASKPLRQVGRPSTE
jgi:Sigma-70, region 4